MKKIVKLVIGLEILLCGLSLIILDVSGIRLFEVTGSCTLIGRVIDSSTGADESAALNILDANMTPQGWGLFVYGQFNVSIPSGTWGLSFQNAYYKPYYIQPRVWVAGQTYDLGTIALERVDISGGHAKVLSVKTIVNGAEVSYVSPGQSFNLQVEIMNDGSTEGFLYIDVYNEANGQKILDYPFIDLMPGDKQVCVFSPIEMSSGDLSLKIVYGHKKHDYTKVQDGEYNYVIHTSMPIDLQIIVGSVLSIVGVAVTVLSWRSEEVLYSYRR